MELITQNEMTSAEIYSLLIDSFSQYIGRRREQCFMVFIFFCIGSSYIAQADLRLIILLPHYCDQYYSSLLLAYNCIVFITIFLLMHKHNTLLILIYYIF